MYKILKFSEDRETILKVEGSLNIPKDERNSDYREYLAWADQGNEAEVIDMTGDGNE